MENITEDNYKYFLQQQYESLVNIIDVERQFLLCHLRSQFVLDDEDYQLIINAGPTRQMKVVKFLDILSCKGIDAFNKFLSALEYDYPKLFEKITGKEAGSKRQNATFDWSSNLGGEPGVERSKEFGDMERQLMCKKLERLAKELQETCYAHQRSIEEKREAENELLKLASEMESKNTYINMLEKQIKERDLNKTNGSDDLMLKNLKSLTLENSQKDRNIINIQSKLISMNEELKKLESENRDLKEENKALSTQIKEVSVSCDSEKRNSSFLNKTVKSQSKELESAKGLEWKLRDAKYKLSIMTEEKNFVEKEYEEFRQWTELLSSRFDVVRIEKDEVAELSDEVSEKYVRLFDTVCLLETKVHDLELKNEFYQQTIKRLRDHLELRAHEKKLNLKKLETVVAEREAALCDRYKLLKEMDQLRMNHDHEMKDCVSLCEKLKKELENVTTELEESRKECMELKKEVAGAEIEVKKHVRMDPVCLKGSLGSGLKGKEVENTDKTTKFIQLAESNKPDFTSILKARRAEDLLNSIRKRVLKSFPGKSASLPASLNYGTYFNESVGSVTSLSLSNDISFSTNGKNQLLLKSQFLHEEIDKEEDNVKQDSCVQSESNVLKKRQKGKSWMKATGHCVSEEDSEIKLDLEDLPPKIRTRAYQIKDKTQNLMIYSLHNKKCTSTS